jgi:hypothetical protein
VHRSLHDIKDETAITEGKGVVAELAKLKYELQHDRELTPIPDDGEGDVTTYNKELAARGYPKWHNVPWLYSECYLYRYVLGRRSLVRAHGYRQTHLEHIQADHEMALVRSLRASEDGDF